MGMTGNYFRTSQNNAMDIREGKYSLADLIYDEAQEGNIIDIDKAWHAIQFTLTGCPYGGDDDNIFSKLVLSGNVLTDDEKELAEFSAMLISVDDVKKLSEALNKLTEEEFRNNFDIDDMLENDIYPIMEDEDEDGFFEYVWGWLGELKEFMIKASGENQVVIFYIS